MTLSAAAEAHRSWQWFIALLVAYGVFLFFAPYIRKIRKPSPTPALPGVNRVKVQASVGVTEDEPAEPEVGWWGKIVEIGGVRMRQVKQVMATGSHEFPEPEEIDAAPDDDEEDDEQAEKIEAYIARARSLQVPYNQIVRVVVEYYGVSESTAKRRIREIDDARRGPKAA